MGNEISGGYGALLLAALASCLLTLLLKTAPVVFLRGDRLPALVRRWLDFIPVSVMGALVGPDIFIYGGKLDFSVSNLFLLASVPTFLIAICTRNYFITIAAGIIAVAAGRYFGLA